MSGSFLDKLASPRPDPGGGAAAAYGAEVGCALLVKVVRLEAGRHPDGSEARSFWDQLLARARHSADRFSDHGRDDVRAYLAFSAAAKRAEGTGELTPLVLDLIECPAGIMQTAEQALLLCSEIGRQCRRHLVADLQVAAELFGATLQGAYHIACANLPWLADHSQRQICRCRLEETLGHGLESLHRARQALASRTACAGPSQPL